MPGPGYDGRVASLRCLRPINQKTKAPPEQSSGCQREAGKGPSEAGRAGRGAALGALDSGPPLPLFLTEGGDELLV